MTTVKEIPRIQENILLFFTPLDMLLIYFFLLLFTQIVRHIYLYYQYICKKEVETCYLEVPYILNTGSVSMATQFENTFLFMMKWRIRIDDTGTLTYD